MPLYYQDDLVSLYHGDCREETAWLEADLLVCDPPFGRKWRQGVLAAHRKASATRARNVDSPAHGGIAGDGDTVVRDRVLELWGNRPAVVFGDPMLAPPAGNRQTCFYLKPGDAGTRGSTAGIRRDVEHVYLTGPWPSGLGGRSSVFTTAARVVGSPYGIAAQAGHPHAKPLDVVMTLIRLDPTATCVADPTAGSGQILIAARLLGLRAIGVELDEKHCENAARRLELAASGLSIA